LAFQREGAVGHAEQGDVHDVADQVLAEVAAQQRLGIGAGDAMCWFSTISRPSRRSGAPPGLPCS
jgi:hypothetical protein